MRYSITSDKPWFIIHYKESGSWKNVHWYPPKEYATFLADMLRNKKPLYYLEIGERKYLSTSAEEIGEEET